MLCYKCIETKTVEHGVQRAVTKVYNHIFVVSFSTRLHSFSGGNFNEAAVTACRYFTPAPQVSEVGLVLSWFLDLFLPR